MQSREGQQVSARQHHTASLVHSYLSYGCVTADQRHSAYEQSVERGQAVRRGRWGLLAIAPLGPRDSTFCSSLSIGTSCAATKWRCYCQACDSFTLNRRWCHAHSAITRPPRGEASGPRGRSQERAALRTRPSIRLHPSWTCSLSLQAPAW